MDLDTLTIDVSKLTQYSEKIKDISGLNTMMAANYVRDFIVAMDLCTDMLSKCVKANLEAKAKLDKAKAVAYLDRAPDYCKENDIKLSNGVREMYVDLDPDVEQAKDTYARTEAMVTFFKNKYQSFRCAHDDVKKLYYDQKATGWEGF